MFESPLQCPEFGAKYAELSPLTMVATVVVAEVNGFDLMLVNRMLDTAAEADFPPILVQRRAFVDNHRIVVSKLAKIT